ncbi:MAG TPA: Gfo/Idh/MocA family oxidoreductase [Verrucomicrobiae bacterium]|nr:Gfo/Idh/MocA family oxidoreductase [Verrucomicrobiae bacterium]
MDRVKVGVIGAGFQADVHCASIQIMPEAAEVVAVASPSPGHARALADRYGIARSFLDYREMLKEPDIQMITIALPNDLHARVTQDAAEAGKHIVCEKPLCLTLEEAEAMIDICRRKGVLLMYGEELPFVPKYVKAKEMAREGAFGRLHLVKQSERHPGPHAGWFWDMERAGGGALMDMGCHGIAFCCWFVDRSPVKSVYCQLNTQLHGEKTRGEDNSLCILEFENGAIGLVENSWSHLSGLDDRIEIHGSAGLTYADLNRGNALPTYSEAGYGYAVEKAPSTKGWSYPIFDEHYNFGMPQELRHFARCVQGKEEPLLTGEDGRLVLEIMLAAYASAREGRKVALPFRPSGVRRPIDLWRPPAEGRKG